MPPPRRLDIRVTGLCLRYRDRQPLEAHPVSFTIPQCRCLAVTSASNADKTCLINVLLRLLEFLLGSVEVGGVPLRMRDGEPMRRLGAVVTQPPHLFNARIRDSLLRACPDATDVDLWSAIGPVALRDEIGAIPAGFDTEIHEAAPAPSAGRVCRLTLAGAIHRDALILILDGPTESLLDTATGRLVLGGLRRFRLGHTTLPITHC